MPWMWRSYSVARHFPSLVWRSLLGREMGYTLGREGLEGGFTFGGYVVTG